MRKTLVQAVRNSFAAEPLRGIVQRTVELGLKLNPSIAPALADHLTARGATLSPEVDPRDAAILDEIPSETTPAERRLLYHFFATIWHGQGSVVEIGPFLGGTTRAIALGMLRNPRFHARSRLYTYDRFRHYYSAEDLAAFVQPLVDGGTLELQPEWLADGGSFREIFAALHRQHDYGRIVEAVDQVLPDRAADVGAIENLFAWPESAGEVDAVFVDGCKSWFATKFLIMEAARRVRPGAYFIFQDYGWYTCFWIPAIVGSLDGAFRLVAYGDTTYAFQLKRAVDPAEVREAIPDEPEQRDGDYYDRIFANLTDDARARYDERGHLILTMQHAGALAYLGHYEEATGILKGLRRRHRRYDSLIRQALASPTYRPTEHGQQPIRLDGSAP